MIRMREVVCIIGIVLISFLVMTGAVFADADSSWYLANMDIMNNNSIVSSAIRYMVWGFTKILVLFANASETLYDKAFGFIDFTTNPAVNRFIGKFKVVLVALTALSLLYLGLMLILSHEKKPKLMTNICFLIFCVCCSTWFFTEMNALANGFKDGIQGTVSATHMTYETIDSHMADLIYLDKKNNGLDHVSWNTKKEYGAGIRNKKTLDAVNYTEVLNFSSTIYDYHGDTGSILKNKLVTIDPAAGDYKVLPLSNGVGWNSDDDADLFNEFYYRYTFDAVSAWMELIALMLIYLTMSYKCIRIAYELVVARLLAYLYSAELSGGEKIRKILVFIRDSYILLVMTTLCIRIYDLMNAYLQDSGITGITKGIFVLFIAFTVIDGPNLVEKLLGMDVGLRSSTARMLAVGRIAMGVGHSMTPKGIAQRGRAIASGRISEGGLAAGAVGAAFGRKQTGEDRAERKGGFFGSKEDGRKSSASDSGNSSGTGTTGGAGGSYHSASGPGGQTSSSTGSGRQESRKGTGDTPGAKAFAAQQSSGGNPGALGSASTDGKQGADGKGGEDGRGGKDAHASKDFPEREKQRQNPFEPASRKDFMSPGTKAKGPSGGSALPNRSTGTRSRFFEDHK